jgi:hypothetical protein
MKPNSIYCISCHNFIKHDTEKAFCDCNTMLLRNKLNTKNYPKSWFVRVNI